MKAPDCPAEEAKACRPDDAEALPEYASPPCYAHEFPGYFGETEDDAAAEPPDVEPHPCRARRED